MIDTAGGGKRELVARNWRSRTVGRADRINL